MGPTVPSNRRHPVPRLRYVEDRRVLSTWPNLIRLMFLMLRYRLAYWMQRRSLEARGIALSNTERRLARLGRRYCAGAAGAHLAARYCLGAQGTPELFRCYARLMGDWSSFMITADSVMDIDGYGRDESAVFLRLCFDAIFESVAETYGASTFPQTLLKYREVHDQDYSGELTDEEWRLVTATRFSRYAYETASQLGANINEIARRLFAVGGRTEILPAIDKFHVAALELEYGQLCSDDQDRIDGAFDWAWYIEIMYAKTMLLQLSPIALFVDPSGARRPAKRMADCVFFVNRIFFHRQVLDDIQDFFRDLDARIAGAPIYLIMAQGRIADRFLASADGAVAAELQYDLERLRVLPNAAIVSSDRSIWRSPDLVGSARLQHRRCESASDYLLRQALANSSHDMAMSLRDLAKACAERRDSLRRVWHAQDRAAIAEIVSVSQVCQRILRDIGMDRRIVQEVDHELSKPIYDGIVVVLDLYYRRTLLTYRRCLRMWPLD